MGGAGDFTGEDVADFGEFAHEVLLGVEAACGVDDEDVGVAGEGSFAGVEGDGAGVGVLLVFDDLDAGALGPDGELLDGGGSEGIAGGEDDFFVLGGEVGGEFGDGGGFAGAVDAGDHDDGGWCGGEVEGAVLFGPIVDEFFLEEGEDLFCGGNFSVLPGGAEVVGDEEGGFDAEVVGDEFFFEFFEEVLVDASAYGEDGFE